MSCYIAGTTDRDSPRFFKAEYLCDDHGAVVIDEPEEFEPPDGKVYVLVIENATFDAALVLLTKQDFLRSKFERMGRDVTWLQMDRTTVRGMVDARYRNEPALR